jgi:hypothetical protein
MDHEACLRGVAALRQEIKKNEARQRQDKQIIRMPRKTKDDLARLGEALDERERGKKYPNPCVSWVQSSAASRKPRLTALYVTYNLVRGKMVAQRVDRYSPCERWGYPKQLREARKIFDDAVAAVPVA